MDTFERADFKNKLETFEWDNVWLEHTEDTTTKRVLYIGDSISCGTRRLATEVADGAFLFDGFGTSKAVDNPFFMASLDIFMQQMNRCDAIVFNNGIHGPHLDEAGYEKGYRALVEYLKGKNVPLYLATSTASSNDENLSAMVRGRNNIVCRLAAEYDCPVIDLYAVGEAYSALHLGDGVHFKTDGYRQLAECIVKTLQS